MRAASYGQIESIKLLIASGRKFNLDFRDIASNTTAIEIAQTHYHDVAQLLQYQENPHRVREKVIIELGYAYKIESLKPIIINQK